MENEPPLSFFELNRRLSAIPDFDASAPKPRRWAKLGFVVSTLAFCTAFVVPRLHIPVEVQTVLLYLMLATEIAGICVNVWNSRQDLHDLREPLNNFARRLDHELQHHSELVSWLARQPLALLKRHASMARFRRDRFNQKLPLMAGTVPTLGLLPVVGAIYLQAREIEAGRHLSGIDFIGGVTIASVYALTWIATLMKSRIEAIDMYLQSALDFKLSGQSKNRARDWQVAT